MVEPSLSQTTRAPSAILSVTSTVGSRAGSEDDNNSQLSLRSTPPTSYNESGSTTSQKTVDKLEDVRSTRKRKSINYNETALSNDAMASKSRNASGLTGKTLVQGEEGDGESEQRFQKKRRFAQPFPDELPARQPRASIKQRVKNVAGRLGSVLGKRKLEDVKPKALKELDMGTGGLLDEIDLDAYDDVSSIRPAKKLKRASVAVLPVDSVSKMPQSKTTRRTKKWLTAGLYVGQQQSEKSGQARKKLQKKSKEVNLDVSEKAAIMPLPMFGYLDHTRDFRIPFDVFAPSLKKGDERPKDWHQLNKNRLIGEAKELWEVEAPMAVSLCTCRRPAAGQKGCGEDCINRVMHYECDEDNCALSASECGNREFADLTERNKKSGAFNIGVEVVKTADRGFGVRACRVFSPGAIVMEYTGEIISEAECQRRMREVYSGKQSYYIMEFDQGLHIDGTRGSMARFVNHSCQPNCEVRMVKVRGIPRMAIFAGEDGVFTGEELTYDYNFDNFGTNKQACYCGAPTCRGVLARRLNATEQKQKEKEDKERQRLAEIEAHKAAVREEKKAAVKAGRGPGWRGWVTVADVKDELKKEIAARQEAERSSARAQRREARVSGVPREVVEQPKSTRRRSKAPSAAPVAKSEVFDEIHVVTSVAAIGTSRFSEDLPRVEQTEATVVTTLDAMAATSMDVVAAHEEELTALPEMPELPAPVQSTKSSMIKAVEQVVKNGFKQSKSKIMRQSLLNFTKGA